MNKARLKELLLVGEELGDFESRLDEILDEERSARDSIPENLENSTTAENMDYWIDTLEQLQSDLSDVVAEIQNAAQ